MFDCTGCIVQAIAGRDKDELFFVVVWMKHRSDCFWPTESAARLLLLRQNSLDMFNQSILVISITLSSANCNKKHRSPTEN